MLIVRAISFQDFHRHRRTDKQTDRRHTISKNNHGVHGDVFVINQPQSRAGKMPTYFETISAKCYG